jgi:hypothetical protein
VITASANLVQGSKKATRLFAVEDGGSSFLPPKPNAADGSSGIEREHSAVR